MKLNCLIKSDEFKEEAKKYCPDINLSFNELCIDVNDDLVGFKDFDYKDKSLEDFFSSIAHTLPRV